jgi:hypothetical protein
MRHEANSNTYLTPQHNDYITLKLGSRRVRAVTDAIGCGSVPQHEPPLGARGSGVARPAWRGVRDFRVAADELLQLLVQVRLLPQSASAPPDPTGVRPGPAHPNPTGTASAVCEGRGMRWRSSGAREAHLASEIVRRQLIDLHRKGGGQPHRRAGQYQPHGWTGTASQRVRADGRPGAGRGARLRPAPRGRPIVPRVL